MYFNSKKKFLTCINSQTWYAYICHLNSLQSFTTSNLSKPTTLRTSNHRYILYTLASLQRRRYRRPPQICLHTLRRYIVNMSQIDLVLGPIENAIVDKERSHVARSVVRVFGHPIYNIIRRKAQTLCVACYMVKGDNFDYPACLSGSNTEHLCKKTAGEIFELRQPHIVRPDMHHETNEHLMNALVYALHTNKQVSKFTAMFWMRKTAAQIVYDTHFELVAFLNKTYPNPLH